MLLDEADSIENKNMLQMYLKINENWLKQATVIKTNYMRTHYYIFINIRIENMWYLELMYEK